MAIDDACRFSGDRNVGEHCDDKAGTNGHAIDGGDDRFIAIYHAIDKIAGLLPGLDALRFVVDIGVDHAEVAA